MKIKILPIPVLLLSFLWIGGCNRANVSQTSEPPTTQQFGVATFMSPAGFKRKLQMGFGSGQYGMMFSALEVESYHAQVSVYRKKSKPKETLQAVFDAILAQSPKDFKGYSEVNRGKISLGGVPALFVVFTYNMSGSTDRIWQRRVVSQNSGEIYAFNLAALESSHERYEIDFQATLDSVKWGTISRTLSVP